MNTVKFSSLVPQATNQTCINRGVLRPGALKPSKTYSIMVLLQPDAVIQWVKLELC